jgi:hypothetical protein
VVWVVRPGRQPPARLQPASAAAFNCPSASPLTRPVIGLRSSGQHQPTRLTVPDGDGRCCSGGGGVRAQQWPPSSPLRPAARRAGQPAAPRSCRRGGGSGSRAGGHASGHSVQAAGQQAAQRGVTRSGAAQCRAVGCAAPLCISVCLRCLTALASLRHWEPAQRSASLARQQAAACCAVAPAASSTPLLRRCAVPPTMIGVVRCAQTRAGEIHDARWSAVGRRRAAGTFDIMAQLCLRQAAL